MTVWREAYRWIRRRVTPITRLGWSVMVLGAAAWAIGALLGWEELSVVAAACFVAVVVSWIFTIGRTQIEVRTVIDPPRLIAGERAVAEFVVRNTAARRMLPVRLEIPIGKGVGQIDVPMLAAGGDFEETIVVPTARRSVIPVGPTRSVRGDPLGLARREIQWTDESLLYIHPRTVRLEGLSSGWIRDLEGMSTNNISMSDVAFHTLREYVRGDDLRHVHWRTSARIGNLMVRQYIDNRRSHLAIVLSTNPADFADADEFEMAVSLAGSLGLRAIIDGQQVSCVAGGSPVRGTTGQALLDGLAGVELGSAPAPLVDVVNGALTHTSAASVVVLVVGASAGMSVVQPAIDRFSADTRILVLRAVQGGTTALKAGPRFTMLEVAELEEFPRLMWSVVNA